MSSPRPHSKLALFGPDFPFDYGEWLAFDHNTSALGTIPKEQKGSRVAIVGGGIAGLVAAYELARMGLSPTIYEPGPIGGRLRSIPMGDAPHMVAELGGMRFPTSGTAFYHYVDQLGLCTQPFPNPGSAAANRTVVDLKNQPQLLRSGDDSQFDVIADAWADALAKAGVDDIRAAIRDRDPARVAELWKPMVRNWDDKSFWNFLCEATSFSDFETREAFGQVGFGTGGWDSDFSNTMLEILRVVCAELDEAQRFVVGGAQQIPVGLWERPIHGGASLRDLHNGSTRPGTTSVSRAGQGFLVSDEWGDTRAFDAVLLTPQTWLLRTSVGVTEDLFSPDLWTALERTDYMSSSKAFVSVSKAFWNEPEYQEAHASLPFSMTMTDRRTRATYLLDAGLVGGDPLDPALVILTYAWEGDAQKVLPLSAAERVEEALTILQDIYGEDLPLRDHIVGEPLAVSWSADQHFLGAFKGALPGHYRYNRLMYSHFIEGQADPRQKGVFLAGDGISWTPAWAEGAVQTALNAVWGIMNHFGGHTVAGDGPGDVWETRKPVVLGRAAEMESIAEPPRVAFQVPAPV